MDKLLELEKKINELEKKLNQSNNMFGRSYALIGSSDLDFLIKTRGQVKIQWGSKFIDLIKNGKINNDSKFINSVNSINDIIKEGLYYVDGKIYLKINSTDPICLQGESEESFVSYSEQESTGELKQQALINLGLICETSEKIPEIQNGFVYVTNEDKLYIIKDGIAKALLTDFLNPLLVQLVINQGGSLQGSLILSGTSKSNGLNFGSSWLYEDNGTILEGNSLINFKIKGKSILTLNSSGLTLESLIVNLISNESESFKILNDGTIYCKELIQDKIDEIKVSDIYVYFQKGYIENDEDISDDEGNCIHSLTVNSDFKPNDKVIIFTNKLKITEDSSEPIILYYGTVIELTDNESSNTIYVQFDEMNEDLSGKYIYLIERNNQEALTIKNNSLYLGYENPKLLIGYNDNGLIFNTIPSGIITMIEKDSDIPNGWSEYNDDEFIFTNLKLIIKN